MNRWIAGCASLAIAGMLLGGAETSAQGMPADAVGAKDHPTISRYAGSWLYAAEVRDFDEVQVPKSDGRTMRLEGRMTRLLYLSPAGKTIADVQRNYETALAGAGATRVDACAASCNLQGLKTLIGDDTTNQKRSEGTIDGYDAVTMLQYGIEDGGRFWHGTLKSPGGSTHVVVYTGRPGLVVQQGKYVATLVLVLEPKALETGKVQVDAKALLSGLAADGRVALYGLYFDTGKSELKAESKPQLEEMAKLLKSEPQLKVYVVGHTDNAGALASNLALSRARAQAVIDALVKVYRIDGARLAAAGVASYAPAASNAAEAGRAKNRRVELVVQ